MIRLIALRELRGLLGAPSTWFILAALQFILAWLFLSLLNTFLQKQAQLALVAGAPGATASVVAPLFGIASLLMMMLVPIFTMRLLAEERRNQTMPLLLSAPVSCAQIVLGKYIGLVLFLWLVVLSWAAMTLTLMLGAPLDIGLLLANVGGLLLLTASYAALGLYVSALTAQPIVAALGALAALAGLWLAETVAGDGDHALQQIAPMGHFHSFNAGLLDGGDAVYLLLFCAFFLLLAIRRVNNNRWYG